MEIDEVSTQIHTETPKRHRSEDDDELSPSVRQEEKVIKMQTDKKLTELAEAVRLMSSKLDVLSQMKDEMGEMKNAQRELCEVFKATEGRVESTERDVTALRESNNQLCERICELEKKSFSNDQDRLNDTLMIRNLPKEICDEKSILKSVVENIFHTLGINLKATPYTANAFKDKQSKSAVVEVKLSSGALKTQAIESFRKLKKDKANNNGQLLVEKFVNLAVDSPLNGKLLMLANKLTPHYLELAKQARKYVGTHFKFVLETPDSRLLIYRDKFHQIDTSKDLQELVGKYDRDRLPRPTKSKAPAQISTVKTRSSGQSQQGE
jgi:hypothetical protein